MGSIGGLYQAAGALPAAMEKNYMGSYYTMTIR